MTDEERQAAILVLRTAAEICDKGIEIGGAVACAILVGVLNGASNYTRGNIVPFDIAHSAAAPYGPRSHAGDAVAVLRIQRDAYLKGVADLEAGAEPVSEEELESEREMCRRSDRWWAARREAGRT